MTTPVSRTGIRTRSTAAMRPALLCAVLLGLFLMHGGPAAADGGCHGAMTAPALVGHEPAMTEHATADPAAPAHPAPQATAVTNGSLCVSTPPRSVVLLPALALTAVLFAGTSPLPGPARAGLFASRRRGPPRSGRVLLLQVCITRT